jgi:hypothetical protein
MGFVTMGVVVVVVVDTHDEKKIEMQTVELEQRSVVGLQHMKGI